MTCCIFGCYGFFAELDINSMRRGYFFFPIFTILLSQLKNKSIFVHFSAKRIKTNNEDLRHIENNIYTMDERNNSFRSDQISKSKS